MGVIFPGRPWQERIFIFLVFVCASLMILGIYTLHISPALSFDKGLPYNSSEPNIQKIEETTLTAAFHKILPEFITSKEEGNWWQMHESVYSLLEGRSEVEVELSRKGEDSAKGQAQVGFPALFEIVKRTWLIYLVALIYLISAVSVYQRHFTTPGLLLTVFFLACSAYFACSAPLVSRSITLHPAYFKFLIKALHISAGGLITLVHFALVFPEPKGIVNRYPWLLYLLYGYFILSTLLYFFGITAFGTTFPFFCLWVLVIVGAFLHSLIQERDPFLKKQISLSLTAPVLASLFFVIFYLLPGVLGMPPVQFTSFALLSLIIPSTLPSAMDNLHLYQTGLEKERVAQEDKERMREDLHDMILNNLATICLASKAALNSLDKDNACVKTRLQSIESLGTDSSRQLREFLQVIDEIHNTWEDLCGYLRRCGDELMEDRNIAFELDISHDSISLSPPPLRLRVCLYLVYRETLLNIIKHSGANKVKGSLLFRGDSVNCRIEDNGTGFDPGCEKEGHYGLKNMKKRVGALGGGLAIETGPGEGTRITFQFPLR